MSLAHLVTFPTNFLGHGKWRTVWAMAWIVLLAQWRANGLNIEGQALLSWMHTLNDGKGSPLLSTWNPQDPNPCNWTGISCSSQGLVSSIYLHSIELLGTVPSQFASLESLQSLVISAANLSGTLPKEIGDYSKLVLLDLSGNKLTGSIPSEFGQLNNLQSLILSSNELEGNIPPELGNCGCTTTDDDLCEIISNISEDGNFNDEDAMLKKIEPFVGLSTQESMAALDKCGFISSSSLVQKLLFRT